MSDATFQTVLYEVVDGVACITLNRPDVLNAFNDQLHADLFEAFTRAREDSAVRCIVLTGAGRAFCSGQDLKEIDLESDRSLGDSVREKYNPLILRIRSIPKPIIAAIHGACAGAGLSLALACDIRFASEKSKLIEVFVRIGLVPDSGSTFFLPRLVGYSKAFELCTTGRDVTAAEALQIGLVDEVIAPELLLAYTMKIARRYAVAPTFAIGKIKALLNASMHADLDTMLEQEAQAQEAAGRSADYKEGTTAFLEKRLPNFTGE